MPTAPLPRIHFFRPGRHVAMSGQAIEFSAADLAAAAAAYDAAKWQAPIVVGHPTIDAPAYGWVKSVSDQDGELYAEPDQVEAQFADLVRAGRFKKVSAAWFTPAHPKNPTPGAYYLKHIGFLGAAAPAVDGLRPVEFAADDSDVLTIEFAGEYDDVVNAGLWRRMRDWFISRFGLDEADKVIPDYAIGTLEEEARKEAAESDAAAVPMLYAHQETAVTPEEKAALEAENIRLQAELTTFQSRQAEADRLGRHNGHAAFAEGLVKDGRLTPAMSPVIVSALDALSGMPEVPQFGDGDAAKPLVDAIKDVLSAAPVVVDYAERTAHTPDAAEAMFAAPAGYDVDAASLDLHRRALAWQATNPTADYLTAVKAVTTA